MNDKIAIYLRLSLADGDLKKGSKDESNSIENQRMLLHDYIGKQEDLFGEIVEYVDDGYTGTNFNRPAFQKMIVDLKQGDIKVIMVKDLSRLGRDYIGVGDYIEQIFPLMGVRFIAVNNSFDSMKLNNGTPGIEVAVSNPFIAVGKITLLQGDPGDGKSTMMMNLIAELSKGGKTPDGKPVGMPQRVIYQCSEDGVSDTIKPRLERCGADCRKVAFINEETYSGLTLDDERIRQAIIEFRPWLVVIDPIQAYLGSDSDLQIAGRARKLMQRLGMWASVYDCAIVLIGHLNKKEGTKGLYRSLGSIDVVAAARSVLQVERDSEDANIRIVRQIKNSLAPSDGEIRFSITAETGFQWLECRSASIPSAEPEVPEFASKTEKAAYLIKKLLSDGDMSAREIYMRMKDEGISRRTAENTKKELAIRSYRKMRQWYWSIHTGE